MGVTNYDNLLQNQVVTTIKKVAQTQREQKGSQQPTSGANVRYHTSDYDPTVFAWTGHTNGSDLTAVFDVTITTVHASTPITDLAGECFTSTDSGATWTKASQGFDGLMTMWITPVNMVASEPYTARWNVTLNGSPTPLAGLALQAVSTDDIASVNVTQVV